jgi:hypothetical protein
MRRLVTQLDFAVDLQLKEIDLEGVGRGHLAEDID